MQFTTASLCDRYAGSGGYFQIVESIFKSFGAEKSFYGQINTLKVFEDDVLIRKTLAEQVSQRVLVIDGGGSRRCALIDAELAQLACKNGWQGLIIYGCIRDCEKIKHLPLGIRALHTHPLKSHQRGFGDKDLVLTFAGVNFRKDHYLYADADGIIVSDSMLS